MKASLVIDYHLGNKIFDLSDRSVNRDNASYSVWLLKEKLKNIAVDLSTCDINTPESSDIVLCFDYPKSGEINHKNAFLFLFESEVIKPWSWELSNHWPFKKIFTWDDGLVDNERYFKFNYSHKFPYKDRFLKTACNFSERKLCALISGNKCIDHPLELYSKRVDAIRWFEKNYPDNFDLYGVGWNKYCGPSRILRKVSQLAPPLNALIAEKYPSYKGVVESKYATLKKYRFAICFENAQKLSGYITEKIFDCFFAGCIPVYWGAENISDHIPKQCFIDMRDFDSYQELYQYLVSLSSIEFSEYQNNIKEFLYGDKSKPFRAEVFVNDIVSHIKAVV